MRHFVFAIANDNHNTKCQLTRAGFTVRRKMCSPCSFLFFFPQPLSCPFPEVHSWLRGVFAEYLLGTPPVAKSGDKKGSGLPGFQVSRGCRCNNDASKQRTRFNCSRRLHVTDRIFRLPSSGSQSAASDCVNVDFLAAGASPDTLVFSPLSVAAFRSAH